MLRPYRGIIIRPNSINSKILSIAQILVQLFDMVLYKTQDIYHNTIIDLIFSSSFFIYFTISYDCFSTVYVLYLNFCTSHTFLFKFPYIHYYFVLWSFCCMYYLQYSLGCTLLDKQSAFIRCFPENHPCKFLIWLCLFEINVNWIELNWIGSRLMKDHINGNFLQFWINWYILFRYPTNAHYTHTYKHIYTQTNAHTITDLTDTCT